MASESAQLKTFDLKEKKLQLIIVVLLIVLLPLLLYLLQRALQLGIRGAPDASLSLVPQNITQTPDQRWVFPQGQEVAVDVVLNSGTNQIEAVEATIFYDPTVLSLKGSAAIAGSNINCSQITPLSVEWVKKVDGLTVDPLTGIESGTETGAVTIVCSAVPTTDQWVNGVAVYQPVIANFTGTIATLRFTTLQGATNSTLSFEYTPQSPTSDSSVLMYEGGCCSTTEVLSTVNNLTFDVGAGGPIPTATPILSITPIASPSASPAPGSKTIRLGTKLQGRNWPGAPLTRQATFKIEQQASIVVGPLTVSINDLGEAIVTDQALSSLAPGSYSLFLKPEGYLQKMTTANIINGENHIDLSASEFLAGDLDGSGRINGLDYNILLQQFRTANTLADIDGSGQVNGIDYSYMLSNWNKQGDGEGV